jgi:hypothetical protein
MLDRNDASDYSGILTIMDCAVNLLVAFDSDEREAAFKAELGSQRLRGHGEFGFALCMAGHYALRPWRISEAAYLLRRKQAVFPEFRRPEFTATVDGRPHRGVFARGVEALGLAQHGDPRPGDAGRQVHRGRRARQQAVCRKFFPHYTLYCVGIKLRADHAAHYEMSCVPPDAEGWAYGCEFEPMIEGRGV